MKRIVVFQDYEHLNKVTVDLNQHYKTIKQMCAPTEEQLNLCKGALSMDFKNGDPEMQSDHIEQMCKESNVSQLINNYLETGSISIESPLFKQHYLWQYVQLLHNRLLYRCTCI